jgi:hypothetical protein
METTRLMHTSTGGDRGALEVRYLNLPQLKFAARLPGSGPDP